MSLANYFRSRILEMLLVFISALSLSMVCFNAFFLREIDALQLPCAATAVLALVLVLFIAAWDRRHLAAGIGLSILVSAVILATCLTLSTGDPLWADMTGNYLYFGAVVVVCTLGAFLLTRTIPGSFVWLVACAVLCSVVQAMYEMEETFFSLAACATALSMAAYRNSRKGVLGARVTGSASTLHSLISAVVPVACGLAAACVLWFAIISPLGPGTTPVYFLTEYRHLPVLEFRGLANEDPVVNTDYTTNNLTEGDYYTTDDLEVDEDSPVEVRAEDLDKNQQQQSSSASDVGDGGGSAAGAHESVNPDSDDEQFTPQAYSQIVPWIILWVILVLLLVAAVVAYFVLRRRARTARLQRLLAGGKKQQLSNLYLFCLGRLRRLGFKVPRGQTMTEWTRGNARRLDVFTEESGVPFEAVTAAYVECCAYGRREPTDDEIAAAAAWYLGFWKGAYSYLGRIRYFFKSFVL